MTHSDTRKPDTDQTAARPGLEASPNGSNQPAGDRDYRT